MVECCGDMSRRVIAILREEAADVGQYSIDEALARTGRGFEITALNL